MRRGALEALIRGATTAPVGVQRRASVRVRALRARAGCGVEAAVATARSTSSLSRAARTRAPRPRRALSTVTSESGTGASSGSGGGGGGWERGWRRTVGVVFFSGIVGGTAYLGAWQTQRYYWKSALVAERQALLAAPPVELPADVADLTPDFAYRRVELRGSFDAARVALVGPRGPPKDTRPEFKGPDAAGYAVIAPLVRPDGSRVLVNLGWMPQSMADDEGLRRCLAAATRDGRAVHGVLGRGDARHNYSPDNDAEAGKFLWVELPLLAQHLGASTDAFIVDAVGELRRGEFPLVQPLDKIHDFYVTPFKHLVYAATWFSLAAAGVVMTYVRFRGVRARGAGGGRGGGKPKKSHAQYAFEISQRANQR